MISTMYWFLLLEAFLGFHHPVAFGNYYFLVYVYLINSIYFGRSHALRRFVSVLEGWYDGSSYTSTCPMVVSSPGFGSPRDTREFCDGV